jgi:homoserine dehydrogenase
MTRRGIGVALLGLGTVGSAVAKVLLNKPNKLAKLIGAPLVLKKVLERDVNKRPSTQRHGCSVAMADRIEEVITDPEIDIVIELIGGEHPALEYITQAINQGKHVVTANKEVIAKHGHELLSLASKYSLRLRYEASVGSGIPLISPFQQDLAANEISAIYAILNGTTNYILTQMSQEGWDFPTALKEAQKLGYAEANPANDIEGRDAAYKLAILSSLAFHTRVDPQDIYCEGISRLQANDFRYAKEFGYAIKLLAIAKKDNGAIETRVHPAFIPEDSQLAKVNGVYNAIQVEGDLAGDLVFYGQGAGGSQAASAIVADVLVIARDICHGVSYVPELQLNQELPIKPMSDIKSRYYFRMNVADRPGVLTQISKVLGDNSISISSVIQKESDLAAQTAVLVIMTHPAEEKAVQQALGEIGQLAVVNEVNNFIRVEG